MARRVAPKRVRPPKYVQRSCWTAPSVWPDWKVTPLPNMREVFGTVLRNRCSRGRNGLFSSSSKRDLLLELLESRTLPAMISSPNLVDPVPALGTNLTLDQSQSLGDLTTAGQLRVQGTIGDVSGTNGQVT